MSPTRILHRRCSPLAPVLPWLFLCLAAYLGRRASAAYVSPATEEIERIAIPTATLTPSWSEANCGPFNPAHWLFLLQHWSGNPGASRSPDVLDPFGPAVRALPQVRASVLELRFAILDCLAGILGSPGARSIGQDDLLLGISSAVLSKSDRSLQAKTGTWCGLLAANCLRQSGCQVLRRDSWGLERAQVVRDRVLLLGPCDALPTISDVDLGVYLVFDAARRREGSPGRQYLPSAAAASLAVPWPQAGVESMRLADVAPSLAPLLPTLAQYGEQVGGQSAQVSNRGGFQSSKDFLNILERHPSMVRAALGRLRTAVLDSVCELLWKSMGMAEPSQQSGTLTVMLLSSWLNRNRPGDSNARHRHRADLSAVVYLQCGDQDRGQVRGLGLGGCCEIDFGDSLHHCFEPGSVIAFHSERPHAVPAFLPGGADVADDLPSSSSFSRISIALNLAVDYEPGEPALGGFCQHRVLAPPF